MIGLYGLFILRVVLNVSQVNLFASIWNFGHEKVVDFLHMVGFNRTLLLLGHEGNLRLLVFLTRLSPVAKQLLRSKLPQLVRNLVVEGIILAQGMGNLLNRLSLGKCS